MAFIVLLYRLPVGITNDYTDRCVFGQTQFRDLLGAVYCRALVKARELIEFKSNGNCSEADK